MWKLFRAPPWKILNCNEFFFIEFKVTWQMLQFKSISMLVDSELNILSEKISVLGKITSYRVFALAPLWSGWVAAEMSWLFLIFSTASSLLHIWLSIFLYSKAFSYSIVKTLLFFYRRNSAIYKSSLPSFTNILATISANWLVNLLRYLHWG